MAAAAPGDVLVVVSPGPFLPFALDKGIVITGTQFTVQPTMAHSVRDLVVSVPSGQSATLDGCTFQYGFDFSTNPNSFLGEVDVVAGRITMSDCTLRTASHGLRVRAGAEVALIRCVCEGGHRHFFGAPDGHGALVEGHVVASDSSFKGSFGVLGQGSPGNGLRVSSGSFHGQRVTVYGGDGEPPITGRTAVNTRAPLWLVNSTLVGGRPRSGPGGALAIENYAALPAQLNRCTLVVANGVQPIEGPVLLDAPLVEARALGLPTLGGTFTLACVARPNEPLALLLTAELSVTQLPFVAQTAWALVPSGYILAGSGVASGLGNLSFAFTLPRDPDLRYRSVWCHALGAGSLPVQVAPALGGLIE